MRRARVPAIVTIAATGAVLTGCSVDTVIWGSEGARVIEVTDQLVQEVVSGADSPRACALTSRAFGDPGRWFGLSAGEPERLTGDFWGQQRSLGAEWTINLEGLDAATAENGGSYPSYVFFGETNGELCVVDIEWGTVSF